VKSQTLLFKGNQPSREPGYSSHHIASGWGSVGKNKGLSLPNPLPNHESSQVPFVGTGVQQNHPLSPLHEPLLWRAKRDPKAYMLSLQSFLREGRVVGLCWANLNLKDLKVLFCRCAAGLAGL